MALPLIALPLPLIALPLPLIALPLPLPLPLTMTRSGAAWQRAARCARGVANLTQA